MSFDSNINLNINNYNLFSFLADPSEEIQNDQMEEMTFNNDISISNVNNTLIDDNEIRETEIVVANNTRELINVTHLPDVSIEMNQPIYCITLQGKKLVYPIDSSDLLQNDQTFLLGGSHKITFTKEKNFIKISEKDHLGLYEYFVDLNKVILDKAYEIYNSKPAFITKKTALEKCLKVIQEKQNCEFKFLACNRHGVGMVAFDRANSEDLFYWAKPTDKEVVSIPSLFVRKTKKSTHVKSEDFFVDFMKKGEVVTINGERAKLITSLNKHKVKLLSKSEVTNRVKIGSGLTEK